MAANLKDVLAKFRATPSPVPFTREEYTLFTDFYGAVQPDDYANPFMGKVLTLRDDAPLEAIAPLVEEGEYEAEISQPLYPPLAKYDEPTPLIPDLEEEETEEGDDPYLDEQEIEEDPNA